MTAELDYLGRHGMDHTVTISGCPACRGVHVGLLSRITGRFIYRCGRYEFSGVLNDWPTPTPNSGVFVRSLCPYKTVQDKTKTPDRQRKSVENCRSSNAGNKLACGKTCGKPKTPKGWQ